MAALSLSLVVVAMTVLLCQQEDKEYKKGQVCLSDALVLYSCQENIIGKLDSYSIAFISRRSTKEDHLRILIYNRLQCFGSEIKTTTTTLYLNYCAKKKNKL